MCCVVFVGAQSDDQTGKQTLRISTSRSAMMISSMQCFEIATAFLPHSALVVLAAAETLRETWKSGLTRSLPVDRVWWSVEPKDQVCDLRKDRSKLFSDVDTIVGVLRRHQRETRGEPDPSTSQQSLRQLIVFVLFQQASVLRNNHSTTVIDLCCEMCPNDPLVWVMKGICSVYAHDVLGESLKRALELDPKCTSAWWLLVQHAHTLQRAGLSILGCKVSPVGVCVEALRGTPTDDELWDSLGRYMDPSDGTTPEPVSIDGEWYDTRRALEHGASLNPFGPCWYTLAMKGQDATVGGRNYTALELLVRGYTCRPGSWQLCIRMRAKLGLKPHQLFYDPLVARWYRWGTKPRISGRHGPMPRCGIPNVDLDDMEYTCP